jgi:hypothetical protein
MKTIASLALAAALATAGAVVLPRISGATGQNGQPVPSERAAQELQTKIDRIRSAEKTNRSAGRQTEVSEHELESYVVFLLKDEIPARIEFFDVQLTPGAVAADIRLTFASNSTGNPVVDALIAGTHSLFLKGRLQAADSRGKFDLEEVRLDGIPVPTILIESLIARYVKPEYPEVDLNQPFPMPWGMESLSISDGKAVIGY